MHSGNVSVLVVMLCRAIISVFGSTMLSCVLVLENNPS